MKPIFFCIKILCLVLIGSISAKAQGTVIDNGSPTNKWILHNPEDSRKSLFLAPLTNANWDWSKNFIFTSTGDLSAVGNLTVGGRISSSDLMFASPYNRLTFPTDLNVGGGITGNDGTYLRLTLYHGHSIALQTGDNNPTRVDGQNTRLFINNLGQVGIGTISPIYYSRLHVHGTGGIITSGSGAELRFRDQLSTRPDPWMDEWVWNARNNVSQFLKVGLPAPIFNINASGKVGIFSVNDPQAQLDVNGDIKANYLTVNPQDASNEGGEIQLKGAANNPSWQMDVFGNSFRLHSNGGVPLTVNSNTIFTPVNVGIGTAFPSSRLHINGGGITLGSHSVPQNTDGNLSLGDVTVSSAPNSDWGGKTTLLLSALDYSTIGFHDSGNRVDFIRSGNGTIQLGYDGGFGPANIGLPSGVWNSVGNVGIGTTNPGAYKLAVEGKIGAREVEVKVGSWADFVFQPGYSLRPLSEVASYISAHQHLPEIPSEAEVKANGIGLGEMNAKLLQKIEELTLYMIQQQKELNKFKEELNELRTKNR